MTSLTCYCAGMPTPTVVTVTKTEGLYTCERVCDSWSLTCSTERESYANEDTGRRRTLGCSTVPRHATVNYRCACEP